MSRKRRQRESSRRFASAPSASTRDRPAMTAIPLSTGRVRPRRRAVVTRHPPALPLAVTAVGWAVLLLLGEHGGTGAGLHTVGLHTVGLHTVEPHVLDPVATAAMVVATMGPLAMPGTRTVAGCSIWW